MQMTPDFMSKIIKKNHLPFESKDEAQKKKREGRLLTIILTYD